MKMGEADKFLILTSTANLLYSKMEDLWDNYSGLPELLNASHAGSVERKYFYNLITGTYRISGTRRLITQQQMRNAVRRISLQAKKEMSKLTQQLISGLILASFWYTEMIDYMTVLYRTIWVLSVGGFLFEDEIARNEFYAFILLQYNHIDNFYEQILNKSQPLDGRAMVRAQLYGTYGNSMWQNTLLQRMIELGYTEAKRILGQNENHCYKSSDRLGCIELAQKGWQSIEQIAPIGNATCYSNCQCHIVYR